MLATADERFTIGAYITNGRELYRITGAINDPPELLEAENCKTGWPVKLDAASVRRSCTLVIPAKPPIRGTRARSQDV